MPHRLQRRGFRARHPQVRGRCEQDAGRHRARHSAHACNGVPLRRERRGNGDGFREKASDFREVAVLHTDQFRFPSSAFGPTRGTEPCLNHLIQHNLQCAPRVSTVFETPSTCRPKTSSTQSPLLRTQAHHDAREGAPRLPCVGEPTTTHVVCSPHVLAEKEETEVVRKYGTGLGECEKTKEERKRETQTDSFRGCTQRETPVQTGACTPVAALWLQLVASLYTSAGSTQFRCCAPSSAASDPNSGRVPVWPLSSLAWQL